RYSRCPCRLVFLLLVGAQHHLEYKIAGAALFLRFCPTDLLGGRSAPDFVGNTHFDAGHATRGRKGRSAVDESLTQQLLLTAVAERVASGFERRLLRCCQGDLLPGLEIVHHTVPTAGLSLGHRPSAHAHRADFLARALGGLIRSLLYHLLVVGSERLVAIERLATPWTVDEIVRGWRTPGRVHGPHQRGGIRRAPAAPTVVEHRLGQRVDALALNLHRQRAGADKFGRTVGVGRNQATAGPLAGDVALAREGRSLDGDDAPRDRDRL